MTPSTRLRLECTLARLLAMVSFAEWGAVVAGAMWRVIGSERTGR